MGSRYVAVLRGLRGDAAEWYRPATQSPLRSGEMQIDADTAPIVPMLGCEWATAQPTNTAHTANREAIVRAAADNKFPPIWRWGSREFGASSLDWAKNRLR